MFFYEYILIGGLHNIEVLYEGSKLCYNQITSPTSP